MKVLGQAHNLMIGINLDDEAKRYLVEILRAEKVTVSELLKQLLRDRLNTYRSDQTVLERMGGMPEHLLAVGGLSDRDNRKAIVDKHIQDRHQARHE